MTIVWEAEADALADFEALPPDRFAPSENVIDCDGAEDVPIIDLYEMLSEGLRIWDQQSGKIYERMLEEPTDLLERFFQKVWRLVCLSRYDKCPDELLDYLAWIVGFGPQQGAATELWALLDTDDKRLMIKLAVKLWKRRGRLDLLSDAIKLFASNISPRIITWFWRRGLVGSLRVGSEDRPETDLTMTITEHVIDATATDIYLTLVRVPDLGTLNREIVEAIADLSRPSNETFEIAYVDFVDTFHDGRNGYWLTAPGATEVEFVAGDSSTVPVTLPAMVLKQGSHEYVSTPSSFDMKDIIFSFSFKPSGPAFTFGVMFYRQDAGPLNGYAVQFDRTIGGTQACKLRRYVAGVPTDLVAVSVDLEGDPALRGVFVDVQDIGGGNQHLKVYLDEQLVLDYEIVAAAYTDGTVGFYNATIASVDLAVSMVEVYERPLDITTLAP